MSKTIKRVSLCSFDGVRLNEITRRLSNGNEYTYTTGWSYHCANKTARHNTRYRWGYPKHWDYTYHTRPRRAKERMALRRLLIDGGDFDGDVLFPLDRKPHIYYW